MEYSLLYPQNAERKSNTLTEESINDLSIDFILAALTDQKYEREHMRKLMVSVTDDPEVIRYRRDVFDDFLKLLFKSEDFLLGFFLIDICFVAKRGVKRYRAGVSHKWEPNIKRRTNPFCED